MYSLVQEWESSGQTQQAFCEEKELNFSTFQYWRVKYKKNRRGSYNKERRTGETAVRSKFIEFDIPVSSVTDKTYSICYPNGVRLECPSGISFEEVAHLIRLS